MDENFGGADEFRVINHNGQPIHGASLVIYTKADFEAGRRSRRHIQASSSTKDDGRWLHAIPLSSGKYVLQVFKKGEFRTATIDFEVK